MLIILDMLTMLRTFYKKIKKLAFLVKKLIKANKQ
jgi:hypothetical protein